MGVDAATDKKSGRSLRSPEETADLVGRANDLLAQGLTRTAVAGELGVSPSTLRRWLQKSQVGAGQDITLRGARKRRSEKDEEIEELQAELDFVHGRYTRLVRTLEAGVGVLMILAATLFIASPWNAPKRAASSAANAYYSAQSTFLGCSRYASGAQLASCYRTYNSALSSIAWPAAAQSTAAAVRGDLQNIAKALQAGGDVTGPLATEATDAQVLQTTLLVLES